MTSSEWAALLTQIVRGMVEDKASVRVDVVPSEIPDGVTTLSIAVHKDEIGRVMGKQGTRINALNVIAQGWAGLDRRTVRVEVQGRYERHAQEAGR